MKEKNDFALVPRSPTAVEKAEPGMKRVLSGMITDALALAKKKPVRPLRIVMMDDVPNVLEIVEFMFRSFYKDATILTFTDAKLTNPTSWRRITS
jgi:hypothetical protein